MKKNKLEQVGSYDEETLMELETFLDEETGKLGINPMYQIVPNPEGGGDGSVYLSEDIKKFLIEQDHDCTMSPEDGCTYCWRLQQLGLLPDVDEDYFEDLDKDYCDLGGHYDAEARMEASEGLEDEGGER